jgi:hypothetical protein
MTQRRVPQLVGRIWHNPPPVVKGIGGIIVAVIAGVAVWAITTQTVAERPLDTRR